MKHHVADFNSLFNAISLQLHKAHIILVYPPNFVILKVVDTSPDTKNDSLSGNKLAELETGAFIKVPFFIKNNEFIKVNTKLLQYVSRVKRS